MIDTSVISQNDTERQEASLILIRGYTHMCAQVRQIWADLHASIAIEIALPQSFNYCKTLTVRIPKSSSIHRIALSLSQTYAGTLKRRFESHSPLARSLFAATQEMRWRLQSA